MVTRKDAKGCLLKQGSRYKVRGVSNKVSGSRATEICRDARVPLFLGLG